ncbi:MAG: hypothetical protein ACON38_17510 [Akkermansiaceae bacterium]
MTDLLCCDRLEDVEFRWVDANEVPEPYRGLLCHERDMTSTLSAFHGGEVELNVYHSERNGESYLREVLLSVGGKPVEYGVILVSLENFPPSLQERILSEDEPLGFILNSSGHPYESSPRGYLEFGDLACASEIFPTAGSGSLYGRYNALSNPDGTILARILEILPTV